MRAFVLAVMAIVAVGLGSCSKFKSYDGPEVTRIVVMKSARQMLLYHHDTVLKAYKVDLGFTANGPKQFEGDGKTPEGRYFIDRRNPNSAFHLSLGISYPNAEDRAFAREQGKSPGGDIFIHGRSASFFAPRRSADWTAGCIAVSNREMEEIYAMVGIGTPIDIFP